MDELRWILLGLGVLIIVGVYGFSRLQDWRRDGPPWRRRSGDRREPFADAEEPGLDHGDPLFDEIPGEAPVVSEARVVATPAAPAVTDSDSPERDLATDDQGEEKIVVLTVMAAARQPYAVARLAEVLEGSGVRLTEQGVFRRALDTGTGTMAVFTVASIVEPGTFDPAEVETATTPGVALIMQLPGPFDGVSAFEQMLAAAQGIAHRLGGQVLDGRRCDLTTQSIEHIREELLEYRRRARLASRQGG